MADDALVELPDHIELSLEDVRLVLAAIDYGRELAQPRSDAAQALVAADRLIVGKLWPELGELMGEDDG